MIGEEGTKSRFTKYSQIYGGLWVLFLNPTDTADVLKASKT